MGERKGVNKYYPPDFDPSKGGLNKYHGTHALRERARKLHEGILIIRFEMPYNIWCNGCGNHIGMGVRYNAQKRKMGNYYTTPIYKFRMKCHLCDQHFEIQTDPKNCDYEILSGCRRKEGRWDTEKAGNVQTTDREVKEKMMTNAMYKLEHQSVDEGKVKKLAPTLTRLEEIRDKWEDDFSVNQLLRKHFREEKKELQMETEKDDNLKRKMGLPLDLDLMKETEEDKDKAKRISYGNDGERPDIMAETKRRKVKESSIFGISSNAKIDLAKSLATKTKQSNNLLSPKKMYSSLGDLGIKVIRKSQKETPTPRETFTQRKSFPVKDVLKQCTVSKGLQCQDDVANSGNVAGVSLLTDANPQDSLIQNSASHNTPKESLIKDTAYISPFKDRLLRTSFDNTTTIDSLLIVDTADDTILKDTLIPETDDYISAGDSPDVSGSDLQLQKVSKNLLSCNPINNKSDIHKSVHLSALPKENSISGEDVGTVTKTSYNVNVNTEFVKCNENSNISGRLSEDDTMISAQRKSHVDVVSLKVSKDILRVSTSLVDYYSSSSSDGDN